MAGFEDRILVVVSAAAGGAISEMNQLGTSTAQADSQAQNLSKTMKGALVAGAAAFIGTGLVSFLSDSVTAYGDAAKSAGDLAEATGGSVENVSRLTAALEDAGIGADTAAGMLTKFTTGASGKNKALLDELNVTLKEGKDGSIDYADGMVQAIDAIMEMGDASARSQALTELFGKKGAQAFQDLIAAGVPLSEAMEQISEMRVFDSEDVRRAQEYDAAMDELSASFQGIQYRIGEALIPVVSGAMDGLSAVIDFMGEIPAPVYAAVAAFVALKVAMESTLVTGAISSIGSLLAPLITGLAAIATGAATVSIEFGVLRAAIMGVMTAAWPLLAIAAIIGAITASLHAMKEAGDAATSMDRVTMSLEDQAKELASTDSAWRTFIEGDDIQNAMEDITGALIDQAKATIESTDATVAEKQAAEELIATLGEGTIEQQTANLATEAGHDAQMKYVSALDAAAGAEAAATETKKGLNEITAQFVAMGESSVEMQQELADAAIEANDAALQQKQATELATIAQGLYATSIQGVVEWQERLAGLGPDVEESLNGVQTAYEELTKTTDNPQTWGDEMEIQAGKAKESLLGLVEDLAAQGWTSEQIKEYLMDMKLQPGASDTMKTDIDAVIAQVEGKENEIPVDLTVAPGSAEAVAAEADAVAAPRTAEVTIDITNNAGAASTLDGVAEERDAPVTIDVTNERGAASTLDGVVDERDAPVNIDILNAAGARSTLDGLLTKRTAPIEIDITNDEGAKWVLDQVAKKRTAIIEIDVRGEDAARRAINNVASSANAAAYNAPVQSIRFPEWSMPKPVNIVKVSVDGKQLRATIRDELLRIRESDDLVAAMGTVA